ncbi:low choriolytic enzyme-like [Heptranchias perlo]|uniref:low choriolytic enzyme-like n=1 Tax=Heptranchias perlo TaxID=212740 RepID=UPI00355AC8AE
MDFTIAVLLTLSLTCVHLVLVDNMNSTLQDGLKREQRDTSEPNVFSIILKANEELLNRTGNKIIQYGDVLVGTSRNAMICKQEPRSCLWPSSKDGNVYVPYKIHKDYRPLATVVTAEGDSSQDLPASEGAPSHLMIPLYLCYEKEEESEEGLEETMASFQEEITQANLLLAAVHLQI